MARNYDLKNSSKAGSDLENKTIRRLLMPIFEYKCDQCKAEFERLVFGDDTKGIKCPACDSEAITKQMSATSFMGSSIGTCAAGAPKEFS